MTLRYDKVNAIQNGQRLVAELLSDSERFWAGDDGSIALLQAYFEGMPVESLRPLLTNHNRFVQRVAAFVASELGREARPLIDDVISLVAGPDAGESRIAMDALDVLAVCSSGELADRFVHVVESMANEFDHVRISAMRLVATANDRRLRASRSVLAARDGITPHVIGLGRLLGVLDLAPRTVSEMLQSGEPLTRRYGAIVAVLRKPAFPELMVEGSASHDSDVSRFCDGYPDGSPRNRCLSRPHPYPDD